MVPPNQAELAHAALAGRGIPTTLVMFEGEGHGFRDPVNQLDEYRRLEEFLSAHCR